MKIIVIGCGRMGAGLAQALSLQGHAVTVHEPSVLLQVVHCESKDVEQALKEVAADLWLAAGV